MTADQAMHSESTQTTRTAFRVGVLDAETARDVYVKLALAKECRKQGLMDVADFWLSKAVQSQEEFRASQTAA